MKIYMLKDVPHDKLGRLVKGQTYDTAHPRFECLNRWLPTWLANGTCERLETKVARENPLAGAGPAVTSSALPAGQVLTPTTLNGSESGEKRKGRPRKASS